MEPRPMRAIGNIIAERMCECARPWRRRSAAIQPIWTGTQLALGRRSSRPYITFSLRLHGLTFCIHHQLSRKQFERFHSGQNLAAAVCWPAVEEYCFMASFWPFPRCMEASTALLKGTA